MLLIKANKKKDLHLELKYSPDLPFYKEDEYYKHYCAHLNMQSEAK